MTQAEDQERQADRREHWEAVYANKAATEVSWYQDEPRLSLEFIRKVAPAGSARIVDVGGGASVLVDRLLAEGYGPVAVLDISAEALRQAKARLGEHARRVEWLVGDITRTARLPRFDVWHDRAVFHFLTRDDERQRYLSLAERTLTAGGHLVIATFGPQGPERCSGLPVCRYDARPLAAAVGPSFDLIESAYETHRTPSGAPQEFVYCLFRRR